MYSDEHKVLNVVMYFVYIILFWIAAAAFYLIFLRELSCNHELIILLGIELGGCTIGMFLKMLQGYTMNCHTIVPTIFWMLSYIAIFVGLQLTYSYFSANLAVLTADTPNWMLTACAVVTVVCLIICSAFYTKVNIFTALYPLIAIVVAIAYCVGSYYLAGWVVGKWEFDAESASYLYFRLPSLLILAVSIAWIVLHLVCKLIVKIGSK